MFPKKRKLQSSVLVNNGKNEKKQHNETKEYTKSWKGRVFVRNKVVKKPERAVKTVVWFASEPAGPFFILNQ
jgi:hypothetical protein